MLLSPKPYFRQLNSKMFWQKSAFRLLKYKHMFCLKKIKAAMTLSKRNFVCHLEDLLYYVLSNNTAPQIYIGLFQAQVLSQEI